MLSKAATDPNPEMK